MTMTSTQPTSLHTLPIIGQLTLPALLGGASTIALPEVEAIAQRLLQEATAWDSSAGVTDLLLKVQPSGFSLALGQSIGLSSVETAHLTVLLEELKETTSLHLGLHIEPTDFATALALWQLGKVQWVALAPFHQSILHPHFGFLSPYPIETLCQQWKIPETAHHWLVVDVQYWSLEALLHHWHYLQQHHWVKALLISVKQAEALHEKALWLAENPVPCWVMDAPTAWLEAHASWLLAAQNPPPLGLCLNQLTLRPLQSTEPWPYSTDTTDPKRIEAYQKHRHQLIAHQNPPVVEAEIILPDEPLPLLVETAKPSKCPFGFGRK
jgi:hypothetical protein